MKDKQTNVVISLFFDGEKILTETRLLKGYNNPQLLIPGGIIEDFETEEAALIREVFEELGVKVLDYQKLPLNEEIRGLKNQLLIPFFIKKWEGSLPEIILDKGNTIKWLHVNEILNSPIEPTRKIVEAFKKYLKYGTG